MAARPISASRPVHRTPDYAVRAARGERLEPRLDDYEAGLVMLRHSADLFVREDALLGADDGA